MFPGEHVPDLRHHDGLGQKTPGGFPGLRHRPDRPVPEGPRWTSPSLRNDLSFYLKMVLGSGFWVLRFCCVSSWAATSLFLET